MLAAQAALSRFSKSHVFASLVPYAVAVVVQLLFLASILHTRELALAWLSTTKWLGKYDQVHAGMVGECEEGDGWMHENLQD